MAMMHIKQSNESSQEIPISFHRANQQKMQKADMYSNINQSSRISLHFLL